MINFEDGQLVERAYIEIDGVKHYVTPAQYIGKTPLSSFVLNKLQDNIELHKYQLTITEAVAEGGEITLPCSYKVRQR